MTWEERHYLVDSYKKVYLFSFLFFTKQANAQSHDITFPSSARLLVSRQKHTDPWGSHCRSSSPTVRTSSYFFYSNKEYKWQLCKGNLQSDDEINIFSNHAFIWEGGSSPSS